MCIICTMATPSDPSIHDYIEPMNATVFETGDAAEGTSTTYTMSVGDTFVGSIDTNDPSDWIAITLQAGTTYQIDALGSDSNGGGTLNDTDLSLYSNTGQLIEYDDMDGAGLDAQITYTATTSGTYYIEVDSYFASNTGTYDLTVQESIAPPPPGTVGTLDELALFLQEGTEGFSRTYDTSSSNQITVNLSGLTSEGAQLARWAMEAWEMVADIDFVEVSSGEMITVDDEDSGAFAYYPNSGSTSDGVELNVSKNWLDPYGLDQGTTIDSYGFQTYVHEFGHALGLRHLGNYDASDGVITYGDDAYFTNDSWQVSLMSYFSQVENPNTYAAGVDYGFTSGPMIADVLAIQNLYGTPDAGTSATAGSTTHGANTTLSNYLGAVYDWWSTGSTPSGIEGNPVVFNIYDVSGHDTLDLSFSSWGDRIDMRQEMFSDVNGMTGNMSISRGTVIEDLIAGSGDDTITGNEVANSIWGGTGNDTMLGEGGNDNLLGGAGFDTMEGGAGHDTLNGEGQADLLRGGDGADNLIGGQGFDLLYGDAGNDILIAGSEPDRLYGGTGDDRLYAGSNFGITVDGLWGEEGNDSLYGEGGFDFLDGGTGNDMLDGGHQADNLYGRDGNDTMYGDLGLDRLFGGNDDDLGYGGDGNDGLFGQHGNDTLYGEAGNDRFFGGPGNDYLDGGSGQDSIFAGAGFDTIIGGLGNDLLQGDFNADTFIFADGHGDDTITDFAATNDFERIDLGSVSAITNLSDLLSNHASQQGSDVLIDTGGGNSITLIGVSLADLDGNDFLF